MATNDINKKIYQAQSSAKKKMDRIRATQRYDISSSAYNPISKIPVRNMTPAQKSAYLKKLQKFNSKDTQFHISARGTVLPTKDWIKYKAAEARANAAVRANIKKYAKLPLPMGGTIGEYLESFRPKFGRLGYNNPSGSAMHELNREPSAVNDSRSLRKLIESQENKASSDYMGKKLRQGRSQFRKMVKAIGDRDLLKAANKLTDEQFEVIWNYTNFASAIALDYEVYMKSLVDEQPFHASVMEQSNRRAHEWIEWVSQVL